MSRSKEIYKETYYNDSSFPGGGSARIDIKDFQETLTKGIELGASEIYFEFSNDRLEIVLLKILTEEEVLQEEIQKLTEALKIKSKELLKVQGKIN
jgi:hypothetical protein